MPSASQSQLQIAYVGIDPGASGGLATITGSSVSAIPMPATDRDIWENFCRMPAGDSFAAIEQNTGYVGGEGNPGSAMFKFGVITGKLIMALTAADVPYEMVTPRVWQKALSIPSRAKTQSKAEFKRMLKQRAEQLFPTVQVTLKTCDALLIAEYCRRKREGLL